MKSSVALLLLALCADGCAPDPCRVGTLYLTLRYAGDAAAADSIALDVSVAGQQRRYVQSRTPSRTRDTLEVDFAAYPRAAAIVIAATVTRAGAVVGGGQTHTTLAAGCTALTLDVAAAAPSAADGGAPAADLAAVGGGAFDLAAADLAAADLAAADLAAADLAAADLAAADLAAADLAAVAPDLTMTAPASDLSTAPPASDLSTAPPAHDLAGPPPPPDLTTTPTADLALPPPTIGFSGESDTAQFPSGTANPAFVDACPAGQALIGFNLAVQSDTSGNQVGINRADSVCAAPAVKPAVGGGWTVVWEVGATLPGHGTADQATVVYQCKSDTFLVGFGGRSGLYLDRLLISCAPLLVDGSGHVSVGATSDSNTGVGGTGGSAFTTVYCPAGQVATMLRTRDQSGSPPDAFGYGCSTPMAVH